MEVKEFISETLKQITEAVEANSSTFKVKGGSHYDLLQKIDMFKHGNGFATYVDFDIAITESSTQDGAAKLNIVGIGNFGGDLKNGTETASRVKFRIPIEINPKK